MNKIIGDSLPNIPWMDKPEGYTMPVWRYHENPIIDRNAIKSSNSMALQVCFDVIANR